MTLHPSIPGRSIVFPRQEASLPSGLRMNLGRSVSIGSAEDVALITEVNDDLQLAAERLDVGSESVGLAALELALLDA